MTATDSQACPAAERGSPDMWAQLLDWDLKIDEDDTGIELTGHCSDYGSKKRVQDAVQARAWRLGKTVRFRIEVRPRRGIAS